VVVRDQLRRAEFQDLVGFAKGRVILATPGSPVRSLAVGGGKDKTLGPVPEGAWTEPLRPARAADGLYGVLRSGDQSRVIRIPVE
jgi:hypothetical protein